MIVTAKEASSVACLRQPHNEMVPDGENGLMSRPAPKCVGPLCMAWRWMDGEIPQRIIRHPDKSATECEVRPGHVPEDYTFVPNDQDEWAHWIEPIGDRARRGYCGLAGIPHIDLERAD